MSSRRTLSDADLLRTLDQAETLVRFNLTGSKIAHAIAMEALGEDREWFLDRANKGLLAAENTLAEARRLDMEADLRGIRCSSLSECDCVDGPWADLDLFRVDCTHQPGSACLGCRITAVEEAEVKCDCVECCCARCKADGKVIAVLGDNLTRLVVAREGLVEGYMAMSPKAKTAPYAFVPDDRGDGEFGPEDRGARRKEALAMFDGFLTGIATSFKKGRPRGRALVPKEVAARVHELMDSLGITKTKAFSLVADEVNYSASLVRDSYYRTPRPEP